MFNSFGEEMSNALVDLAKSINNRTWCSLENLDKKTKLKNWAVVSIFLKTNSVQRLTLAMHSARLKEMGIEEVRGVIFDVNQPLTTINKGPING
ncbi:YdhR family protein [Vibrio lentus]|nr:YdhR family protein [Vibrio lentus]